jgi:hypothetical protein
LGHVWASAEKSGLLALRCAGPSPIGATHQPQLSLEDQYTPDRLSKLGFNFDASCGDMFVFEALPEAAAGQSSYTAANKTTKRLSPFCVQTISRPSMILRFVLSQH